jgi:hypothetical protein
MREFKKFWPVRSRTFRLFLLVAGVFLLTAAFAPKVGAQGVLIYFNFEDNPIGPGYDNQADVQGFPDFNPGGGVQTSTLTDNFVGTGTGTVAGTTLNRTPLDIDTSTLRALGLRTTPLDNGHWIQFGFNASTFSNMSLSFAVNSAGNGFNSVELQYSITPGHPDGSFVPVSSLPILAGGGFQVLTFSVPAAVDGQPDVVLRLVFTGGTSQGNNLQTVIDNIQLTGVPEPTTVAGGLLGVLGLCWHQRRRLRFLLPRLRRT